MPPDRIATAPGVGHAQIADHNSRTILEALRRNGPMTRIGLAALTGLTAPGVTNIVRRHLTDGLIIQGQRRTESAQVPSAEYALRPEGAHAIGMRLRRDRVEAILIDLGGTVCGRAQARRIGSDMEAATAVVEQLLDTTGAAIKLIGIGLALDDYGEQSLAVVRGVVPHHLVVSELDTVTAVLAERTLGAGVPDNGMVMVLLEERIRSGLFLHSIPFAGVHGRAGRIGEMHTGSDRLPLDQVCSADAFALAMEGLGERGSRDTVLNAWVDTAAEHLFDALMAMAGFVAPGKIVLDGDLPLDILQALIPAMHRVWENQRTESPPPALPPVTSAAFPGDSVLLGAALLPFFDVLLPRPFVTESA